MLINIFFLIIWPRRLRDSCLYARKMFALQNVCVYTCGLILVVQQVFSISWSPAVARLIAVTAARSCNNLKNTPKKKKKEKKRTGRSTVLWQLLTFTVLRFMGVVFNRRRDTSALWVRASCSPWFCVECEKPGSGPRPGKHSSGHGLDVRVFMCVRAHPLYIFLAVCVWVSVCEQASELALQTRHLTRKPETWHAWLSKPPTEHTDGL